MKTYLTDHRLTSKELKKFISQEYGVKVSKIDTISSGRNYVRGDFVLGKAKYEFDYNKDKMEINVFSILFRVEYLRETPFGYGGGWERLHVYAKSEEDALHEIEESCKKRWGSLSPCSKFRVIGWDE